MAITAEGIYEGGVLKLDKPLPLPECDKVRVTLLNVIGDSETPTAQDSNPRAAAREAPRDCHLLGTYQVGTLRLDDPLVLRDSDKVRVSVLRATGLIRSAGVYVRASSRRAASSNSPRDPTLLTKILVGSLAGALGSSVVATLLSFFLVCAAAVYTGSPNNWIHMCLASIFIAIAFSIVALPAGLISGVVARVFPARAKGLGGIRRQALISLAVAFFATSLLLLLFSAKGSPTILGIGILATMQLIASIGGVAGGMWSIRRRMA